MTLSSTLPVREIPSLGDLPEPVLGTDGVFVDAMYGTSPLLRYVITAGVDRLGTALSEAKHAVPTQKLGFIYTSCMWVHGHNPLQTVGDTDPVGVPSAKAAAAGIVGWRPALERDILAARSILDVVILRPAMMYGRSSGIWGTLLFGPILAGVMNGSASVRLVASKDCNVSTAHVDDVATAFVGAVERIHMLAGNGSNSGGILPIFNLQTGYENIGTIVDSAARMFGYGGAIEYASVAEEPFSEAAFGTSINADSSRARAILGWQPSRLAGLVGGMSIYGYAFAAVGDAPAVLAAIAAAKAKGAVP